MGPPAAAAPQSAARRAIVLVGMMGAGKTTVGRRLAARLGLAFVDADSEIERAAGLSIADIFDLYGEAAFRDGERRVIERLLAGPPKVLATGGGAFMNPATRALIQEKAVSVWLKADLEVLVERTARRDTRPLLRGGDARDVLARLLAQRQPVYAEAALHVATGHGPHEAVVEAIIAALPTTSFDLSPP
ncbi:MAG: shikimate kinase [Pseudomonadota bacterium]